MSYHAYCSAELLTRPLGSRNPFPKHCQDFYAINTVNVHRLKSNTNKIISFIALFSSLVAFFRQRAVFLVFEVSRFDVAEMLASFLAQQAKVSL